MTLTRILAALALFATMIVSGCAHKHGHRHGHHARHNGGCYGANSCCCPTDCCMP